MNAPLDRSVVELLRHSAIGSAVDRPVNDVLKDMGLPALPQIPGLPPMPEFPPLPVLDLSVLTKPLTDLAGTFGTGRIPAVGTVGQNEPTVNPAAAPAIDPVQALSQVSSVVQTAVSLGTSAMQIAQMLWQGQGATSAGEKAGQAATDGAAVSEQSAETSVGVTAAAGSVFQGATVMSGIIARYMTSLVAATPFLPTPPGQAFVVALTADTLAQATACVAKTRAELTVHSAAMTKTGKKVPVTGAPKNVDPTQAVQQMMQLVGPLTQMANAGGQALQAAQTALYPAKATVEQDAEALRARHEAELRTPGGALGGGAAGIGAGGSAVGSQARQLTPWAGMRGATSFGPAGASMPAAESASTVQASSLRGAAGTSPGAMPLGGAANAAGARAQEQQTTEGLRGLLVTGQHGDEVVGPVDGVSMPVVGAPEQASGPMDSDPPDKALTL
ncbi:hypothetical protein AB0L57_10000 [Nocardia sp. NPDC052254]|uniref:hypothetical protein n=1 Tax=Nocardia sp. NPDC052254 TaxID=3155681 RepID=UPI00341E5BCE